MSQDSSSSSKPGKASPIKVDPEVNAKPERRKFSAEYKRRIIEEADACTEAGQTSLLRLQQRRWISAEWGASENNRKAKYYSITKSGRKQLACETENWERIAGVIGRLLSLEVRV